MSPAAAPRAADRPLRRDAERNRQRILEAARARSPSADCPSRSTTIARRAGVGVGTVYRRFPDKEQLIDALFEDRIAEIARSPEPPSTSPIRGRGSHRCWCASWSCSRWIAA